MAAASFIGARIRERRLALGIRQGELARRCEISASYLNLIEHDRRRIGGRLLNRVAGALDIAPQALSRGGEAALLDALAEAAAGSEAEPGASVGPGGAVSRLGPADRGAGAAGGGARGDGAGADRPRGA